MKTTDKPGWGLLPQEAIAFVKKREWDNLATLKARLLGKKNFPLRINLKPPNGVSALDNINHFHHFVSQWQQFPLWELVHWQTKNLLHLSEQTIPTALELHSIHQLASLIGDDGLQRCQLWEQRIAAVINGCQGVMTSSECQQKLYPALVKRLDMLEALTDDDCVLLTVLLPQLTQGLGAGSYLRALPLKDVDTKFLESHLTLIEGIVDAIHDGAVMEKGGLVLWLACRANPKDWRLVRPLCEQVHQALGGIPILKIPTDTLLGYELPAANILVIENIQSGLALPAMANTIAVIGGGKNIAWMAASWLKKKRVAYWGDIDTWGFECLSDARNKLPRLESLMMDKKTVKLHEQRMVIEPKPVRTLPKCLSKEEAALFYDLKDGRFQSSRLEQERLSADYIQQQLYQWLSLND